MANEFYLNGTAAIGRATGGIMQQIVPLRAGAAFSRAVRLRAQRWHSASAHPTGVLYREKDDIPSLFDDWRGINAGQYDAQGGSPDRLEARREYPLFVAMAAELQRALADGVRVYEENPELYYRMVTEGLHFVQRSFSWERAATEYVRLALP